jgi:hypothetical protein
MITEGNIPNSWKRIRWQLVILLVPRDKLFKKASRVVTQ